MNEYRIGVELIGKAQRGGGGSAILALALAFRLTTDAMLIAPELRARLMSKRLPDTISFIHSDLQKGRRRAGRPRHRTTILSPRPAPGSASLLNMMTAMAPDSALRIEWVTIALAPSTGEIRSNVAASPGPTV